jgi:RND family efflux transporter MFP subunit
MAVAEADIDARLAQLDLDDAREGPTDAEIADARAAVQSAQSSLLVAQYAYSSTLNSSLDSAVRARQIEYLWYVDQYWAAEDRREEGTISQEDHEQTRNDQAAAEWRFNTALQEAQLEDLDSQNQVAQANNSVYQAWENLQLLQTEPTTGTILRAELQTDKAVLALEEARADLEAAELRAPFDGTIVDVTAMPGEDIGTSAIITLADLEEPILCFWVEESEMSGVAVGHRVEIIFEALPDESFSGEVTRVDPALVKVDNTLAVQAWASIDLPLERAGLLGGLNADVEVISAEARDVLLVPVEALRELDSSRYAVFVVQPDGEMMLRPVEVGLQDFVYAEILSGLELGEVVSKGVEERQETVVPEQQMPPGGPPGPGMPMLR